MKEEWIFYQSIEKPNYISPKVIKMMFMKSDGVPSFLSRDMLDRLQKLFLSAMTATQAHKKNH